MQFPLRAVFRILELAPQIHVTDAAGKEVAFARQRLIANRKQVSVYTDSTETRLLYLIKADRFIDQTANYAISDAAATPIGHIERKGLRSIWRAHYMVVIGDRPVLEVNEVDPVIKLLDGLVGMIPVVGWLTGLFLHPSYVAARPGGAELFRIRKRRALFETIFSIDRTGNLSPSEQETAVVALYMIVLLERLRG